MTAYSAIADSEIDPESPGTTTLFGKLRNNPIAITEGSSGAPQLQTDAIAADAVNQSKIDWANAGGISQGVINMVEKTTTSVSPVIIQSFKIYIPDNANSLKYYAELKGPGGAQDARFRLEVSGGASGSTLIQTASSYTHTGIGTLNISAESGWTTINVVFYGSSVSLSYLLSSTYRIT